MCKRRQALPHKVARRRSVAAGKVRSHQQEVVAAPPQRQLQHAPVRSALLPYVSSDLLVSQQQINLAALGFSGFPGIPQIVGPFQYVDLRSDSSNDLFELLIE